MPRSKTKVKFEVGDWVVFEDAKQDYDDLHDEEDWSHLNGALGIVERSARTIDDSDGRKSMLRVRLTIGGPFPTGAFTTEIDYRHFKRIVKKSQIDA